MSFDKYVRQGAYHWLETDAGSNQYNPPLVARYQVLLDQIESGTVLDVGAGDGYLSAQLAKRCEQVIALEYESAGAALAKSMLSGSSNVAVLRGDTFQLPLADACLDQVVMADVIEHLENAAWAVKEVARVLKPGGRFLLTTPKWRPDRVWDRYHVKEYRPEELHELLSAEFGALSFSYFWPLKWSNRYATRVGWRLLKVLGRLGFNPFLHVSNQPEGFGQMMVVATGHDQTVVSPDSDSLVLDNPVLDNPVLDKPDSNSGVIP
ncbi:MAG: SAM-dependent methyltransferase [Candidatus Azotimanducaceae bacterium]|jgi:SAM-dependent methyltransferase